MWKRVWKLHVPERIRVFMWLASHKRLLTRDVSKRWDGTTGACPVCSRATEDQLHVLRDCPRATQLWRNLVPRPAWRKFFSYNWRRWWNANVIHDQDLTPQVDWTEIFAVGCWFLWKWRNSSVHDEFFTLPRDMVGEIYQFLFNYRAKWVGDHLQPPQEEFIAVRWTPPKEGWCKINVDGCWLSPQEAGGGGVIRGDKGEWLGGISFKTQCSHPLEAEAAAVIESLDLGWQLGFKKVELECDAKELVTLIHNRDGQEVSEQITRIKTLLQREWQVIVSHCYRESNRCADRLAYEGRQSRIQRKIWTSPPREVEAILQEEAEGRAFPLRITK